MYVFKKTADDYKRELKPSPWGVGDPKIFLINLVCAALCLGLCISKTTPVTLAACSFTMLVALYSGFRTIWDSVQRYTRLSDEFWGEHKALLEFLGLSPVDSYAIACGEVVSAIARNDASAVREWLKKMDRLLVDTARADRVLALYREVFGNIQSVRFLAFGWFEYGNRRGGKRIKSAEVFNYLWDAAPLDIRDRWVSTVSGSLAPEMPNCFAPELSGVVSLPEFRDYIVTRSFRSH